MKRILIIWALLISVCFAQSKPGFYVVGGKIITVQDTSSRKYLKAIENAGVVPSVTQNFASNYLVTTERAISTWTLMKAQYPFIGGTAATHKFNLNAPLDLDASFRLVYGGTLTHSSNGVQGNGSTGYANTFIVPSTVHNTTTGATIAYYVKTPNSISTGSFGSLDETTPQKFYFIADRPNLFVFLNADYSTSTTSTPNKFNLASVKRTSKAYVVQNGILTNNIVSNGGSSTLPSSTFTLFGRNQSGNNTISISSGLYENHLINFFMDADYLTDTQAILQSRAVTAFEGFLGRQ